MPGDIGAVDTEFVGQSLAEKIEVPAVAGRAANADDDAWIVRRTPFRIGDVMASIGVSAENSASPHGSNHPSLAKFGNFSCAEIKKFAQ